jgi:hypothetical protein
MTGASDNGIMLARIHFHDPRADRLPKLFNRCDCGGIAALGRRDDGNAAVEEVGVGGGGAVFFAARNWVAADEVDLVRGSGGQRGFDFGDELLFGAAGVGDEAAGFCGAGGFQHLLRDRLDGRANDDEVGLACGGCGVGRDFGDAAQRKGLFERLASSSDAEDFLGEISLAQGQSDGAADEAHADDRDGIPGSHFLAVFLEILAENGRADFALTPRRGGARIRGFFAGLTHMEFNAGKHQRRGRTDGAGSWAWALSLLLHAGLLAAAAYAPLVKPRGGNGGGAREVSVVLAGGQRDFFEGEGSRVVQVSFVENLAPSLLPYPAGLVPLPQHVQPQLQSVPMASADSNANSAHGGAQGPAETRVFGVAGKGTRFVYVFDRSSSMEGAPLAAAKRELIASLQQLEPRHQFQIMFYNEAPEMMPSFRGAHTAMTFADERGKRLAASFAGGVFAHGGTEHLLALKAALALRPDVIFVLTDANEPQMRPDELRLVRQINRGTAICTIEFGLGPPQPSYNFLQQLAAENGGEHAYVDVRRLAR